MANKGLFASVKRALLRTDAVNEAGGRAYALTPEGALAQVAVTGCFHGTYYVTEEQQLETLLKLCGQVELPFVAKTAVYCREKGFMKDTPAALAAYVASKDTALLGRIFPRVIDNGKMLRNFVQMVRSGQFGRKSFGTRPKKLIQAWLAARPDAKLFADSVGSDPSLADIIKMVHPKPANKARKALYAYLIGREYAEQDLPEAVQAFEAWKRTKEGDAPDVPFQMLTSLELDRKDWAGIARNGGWHMIRMNLNTFARHGVFEEKGMTAFVADRLRDEKAVRASKVFPYQLMAAYKHASDEVPVKVREALQDAMEIAIQNVPEIDGKVYVFPDISGSMRSPVTGWQGTATTKVQCIDVAALVSAAILRRNPEAEIIPFREDAVSMRFNPRDSVMTTAARIGELKAGGTNCSAPLALLNRKKAKGDLVVYISDCESWVDSPRHGAFGGSSTATMKEWGEFKKRNPAARMVCIDLQPNTTTQAKDRADVLNIGGFSDQVFELMRLFASGKLTDGHWAAEIKAVEI